MRPKSIKLGLLVVVLIAPLISCRSEKEQPLMGPSPTTPVRAATATPQIIAPVTSEPDPLSGTRWELISIDSKESALPVPERPRLFLTFDRGALDLSGGCNSVGGHYVLQENQIEITFSKTTEMDCSGRYPGINEVEQAFFYAMSTFESYAIETDRLVIRYADGEILLRRASEHMSTPTPTAVSTWTAVPTHTPCTTQTPTALPTATQTPTPTPFSKVELPIGALAFITYDRQLLVRDPVGEICAIAGNSDDAGIVHSTAWSPDGTRLAFSYQADDKADPELRIYDLQTGDQTTAWTAPDIGPPYADPICEIAWSPSGRYLAFSQGCCPLGPVSIWDLEAVALAGYRGAYRMFWRLDEDVLTLSIPQPVGEFIPIGSGDSTSIALVRPYEISPTVVLTGTTKILYDPRAWLSSDKLAYMRLDLGDKEKETEHTWWRTRIVDGEAVNHRQLDAPPLAHDNDPLQEHLSPWLPAVTVGDYDWSADGTWVVFSANQDREERWRIYAFHWAEGRLVGPFAEAAELALAPVRTTWRCPE